MVMMKRGLAVLLSLLLTLTLFTACGSRTAQPETPRAADSAAQAETQLAETMGNAATALALGLRFFDDPSYLDNPSVLWNVLGWYSCGIQAAGADGALSAQTVKALQRSLRPGGAFLDPPETWVAGGSVTVTETAGETFYAFPEFAADYPGLMEQLQPQVTAEGQTLRVVLTNAEHGEEIYEFRFRADARSSLEFPYMLESISLPPVQGSAEAQSAQAEFTLEDLVQANRITTLLNRCKSVEITSAYATDNNSTITFFKKEDAICRVSVYRDGEGTWISGARDNTYFDVEFLTPDRSELTLKTEALLDAALYEEDPNAYSFDFGLAGNVVFGELQNLRAAENTYEFDIVEDQAYDDLAVIHHYVVDRDSLAIQSYTYHAGTEYETVTTVRYDGAVEDYGMFDGWSRPLRTVTFILNLHDAQGNEGDGIAPFEVPDNMELLVSADRELFFYQDAGYTKPYAYPGNGTADYTVYTTDAAG